MPPYLAFFLFLSGWLLRHSAILKLWNKNWFDLCVEDKVHMQVECLSIPTGQECQDSQPLDGKSKDCILPGAVAHVCNPTISLCVENTGDCLPLRNRAVSHTVVCARQELKLSMLLMDRHMLCPARTPMQDLMDSSLLTKSSFKSDIQTMTVTWHWACWWEWLWSWP
uniref:Uncharacterized protein n=1 Tax=Theropithecus gelada TaxID=9565 RepID=A0A8D2JU33_THEGE